MIFGKSDLENVDNIKKIIKNAYISYLSGISVTNKMGQIIYDGYRIKMKPEKTIVVFSNKRDGRTVYNIYEDYSMRLQTYRTGLSISKVKNNIITKTYYRFNGPKLYLSDEYTVSSKSGFFSGPQKITAKGGQKITIFFDSGGNLINEKEGW